jgi:hypothetical protein
MAAPSSVLPSRMFSRTSFSRISSKRSESLYRKSLGMIHDVSEHDQEASYEPAKWAAENSGACGSGSN